MSSPEPLDDLQLTEPAPAPSTAEDAVPATSAAVAAPEAPAAASDVAVDGASKPRRVGCLKIGLALFALVLVVGGLAGGAWWFMNRGPATVAEGPAADVPQAPQPAGPPPALSVALAAPSAEEAARLEGRPLATTVSQIPELLKSIETQLVSAPLPGGAPSDLIVPASGRQAADRTSEIPRHERWEIQFPPGNTLESYTRQLDYFKIEIGIIGGSDKIDYLVNISEPLPTARSAPASAEKRLYLIWQRGSMREADERLAARAKVSTQGKIIAHFCSDQLENELVQLEEAHARQAKIDRIRKTTFGIKANDFGGFQFVVVDQKAETQ